MFRGRILLLIPHPDDEAVGCVGAIGRAQAQGGSVFGFYLTTGIPPREALWWWPRRSYRRLVEWRRREAEEVAELLQIEAVQFQEIPSRTLKD
ncbi:MAG: PIG-L family deacetylase, partial [Candidatus Methylomirabilales bacterium]